MDSTPPFITCRSTRHIFLDLPQLSPKLQEYITTTSQLGGWSSNCVQVGRETHSACDLPCSLLQSDLLI